MVRGKVLCFGCSSKSDHEIVEIYTPPVTKKQKSLFSFFKPHLSEPGSSLKHKKVVKSNSSEKVSSREWEKSEDDSNTNPNDNVKPGPSRAVEKTRATITRNVKKDAVENWKYSNLEKYDGQEWLDFDVDKDGHVIALKCKVCSTYSSNIENIKNFSHAWAFEGSVNLRVSNAMDHAKGSPHKSAMELYWKNSSISEEEKAEKLRDNRQQSIVPGIACKPPISKKQRRSLT